MAPFVVGVQAVGRYIFPFSVCVCVCVSVFVCVCVATSCSNRRARDAGKEVKNVYLRPQGLRLAECDNQWDESPAHRTDVYTFFIE